MRYLIGEIDKVVRSDPLCLMLLRIYRTQVSNMHLEAYLSPFFAFYVFMFMISTAKNVLTWNLLFKLDSKDP